jgi:hypothetical protein
MRSNIAAMVNAEHAAVESAKRQGVRHAIECGRLLSEAKATSPHGQWDEWVKDNCNFSARTAQLYMRVFRHVGDDPAKAQRVADLSLREIAKMISTPGDKPKAKRELTREERADLDKLLALWYAAPVPWRIGFTDELLKRGEITPDFHARAVAGLRAQIG